MMRCWLGHRLHAGVLAVALALSLLAGCSTSTTGPGKGGTQPAGSPATGTPKDSKPATPSTPPHIPG